MGIGDWGLGIGDWGLGDKSIQNSKLRNFGDTYPSDKLTTKFLTLRVPLRLPPRPSAFKTSTLPLNSILSTIGVNLYDFKFLQSLYSLLGSTWEM